MPSKNIPINIHYSDIGNKPNIVVPVKYLINQVKIECNNIGFEIKEGYKSFERKGIVIIKKCRKHESKEKCENNTINNEKWMPMTHEIKLFVITKIFSEKNLIKIVHTEQ